MLNTSSGKVRSIRPRPQHRKLCCSRKRSSVDRAIAAASQMDAHSDPLKHMGFSGQKDKPIADKELNQILGSLFDDCSNIDLADKH